MGSFEMPGPHEPITMQRAHRILGISVRTLYNWMEWGWLPYTHSTGPYQSRRVRLMDIYAVRPHLRPGYKPFIEDNGNGHK